MIKNLCFILLELATSLSWAQQTDAKMSDQSADSLQRPKIEPPTAKSKLALFNNVTLLLTKLSLVGIGQLSEWRKDELGYISGSPNYQISDESDEFTKSSLAFYVESLKANFVQTVKLIATVNPGQPAKLALSKYARVAAMALYRLGLPIPKEFQSSLATGKPYRYETDLLSIVNEVHHDQTDWCKLTITAK